jgi:hypothetical protein
MKLIIDTFEMEKIKYWVEKCPQEIGGLGLATITPEGDIRVTDVFLLAQEVTGAETELDDNAITSLMTEVLQDATLREKGSLQFWWHSHANMGVFWSGTDQQTIKKLSRHGWFASLVINKKFETKAAYSQGANNGYPYVMVDDIAVCSTLLNSEIQQLLDCEYKDKVKHKVYAVPVTAPIGARHWYGDVSGYKNDAWFDDDRYDSDGDVPISHLSGTFGVEQKPVEPIKCNVTNTVEYFDEHDLRVKKAKNKKERGVIRQGKFNKKTQKWTEW